MSSWLPWSSGKTTQKDLAQADQAGPQNAPNVKSELSNNVASVDAMDVEGRTNSISASLEQQKLEDVQGNLKESSLDNHVDTGSRPPKRTKDVSDYEDSGLLNTNVKRRRSPTPQSDVPDQLPQGHETSRIDSPGPDRWSIVHDTSLEEQEEAPVKLLKNLETRPITVAQLIQEVKGIYAGLVMVEKKCIEIVTQQAQNPTKLSKEQWQALIALHRTLLNEHHDFFSASHHPITEGHELRELAARYAMPARMWRHGIHAFLELLRHRLPESLEHMLSFVYLSYSMMALLKETVPDFVETWIECLGDLARYRMAIEEADLRDREVWSSTARTWYNEAADLSPNTGRIQHHLAVLARPNIVQQLFLYSKALVAAVPFRNAGESILLLFNPLLDQPGASTSRYQVAELNLVSAAGVLFKRRSVEEFMTNMNNFVSSLETHMARTGSRFKVQGPEIAGGLLAMLMDFGNAENHLWSLLMNHHQQLKLAYCAKHGKEQEKLSKDFIVQDRDILDAERKKYWSGMDSAKLVHLQAPSKSADEKFVASDEVSTYVGPLLQKAISDVAGQIGNKNVVPFMHQTLAHLYAYTWIPGASVYLEKIIPWTKIVEFLNTVGRSGVNYENVEGDDFPKSFGGTKRQLPEDFVMRGLMSMATYYPAGFFDKDELVDEDERLLEQPSHQAPRVERCLYCAIQLAKLNDRWLTYNSETKMFSTSSIALKLNEQ